MLNRASVSSASTVSSSVQFADVIVDLLQPLIPAYAHVLDRAVNAQINGKSVRIGSAEGLIVTKLIAMRPQDEADIRELLVAYAGKLDLEFVRCEMDAFTDASDARRAKFDALVRDVTRGATNG